MSGSNVNRDVNRLKELGLRRNGPQFGDGKRRNAAFKRETVSHFIDHGGNTSVGYAGTETSPIAPSLHGSPASIDLRSSCAGKSEMCRNSRSVAPASSIDSTETSTRTPDAFAQSSHCFPRDFFGLALHLCVDGRGTSFASACVRAKKHNPSSAAARNSTPAPRRRGCRRRKRSIVHGSRHPRIVVSSTRAIEIG